MWFTAERPASDWRERLLFSGISRPGSNRVLKRIRISRESLERVLRRLERIRLKPPERVPRLRGFRRMGESVELCMDEIDGRTLLSFARERDPAPLRNAIEKTLARWRAEKFVHGDLSPSNIVVARDAAGEPEVWFVDWVADLESFEGTPRYASPEILAGRHTHDSDAHAVTKIFKDYDRGFRPLDLLVRLRNAGTGRRRIWNGPERGSPEKKSGGALRSFGHSHPRCAPFLF